MDAVNPDYIVVRFLDSMNQNFPVWVMPGNLIAGRFPLLVQFYHGSLPYYLGLPTYLVFGTGLFGIRVTGALFGVSILFALLVFARGLKVPVLAAAMGLLVLATDPAFILGLRTQFYIKMIPAALVIAAIGTIAGNPSPKRAFIAGVLAGLAVHGYFIHAFPAAAITAVVLVWPGLGNRARLAWIGGIALGFLPSVIGITLVYLRVGDWEGFREFIGGAVQAQSPGQSSLGLLERASAAIGLANLAWQGFAAQLMALQEDRKSVV